MEYIGKIFLVILLIWQQAFIKIQGSKYNKRRTKLRHKLLHHDVELAELESFDRNHTYESASNLSDGAWTKYALKRMLWKALRGEDVTLYVIGESVSVGADLGENNTKETFHYFIAKWWNNTVGKITGSRMHRNIIAVGGVGSTYFDRCWKEYVEESETFDLLIWEFNINDSSLKDIELSLERFTRSLYMRYDALRLLFSIFYSKTLFSRRGHITRKNGSHGNLHTERRHTLSENITARNAYYYNVSYLNIEDLVSNDTTKQQVFIENHPSKLAHAQMAIMIIHLFKRVFIAEISKLSRKPICCDKPVKNLPSPLYVTDDSHDVVCWTAVYVDYRHKNRLKHRLSDLQINKTKEIKTILTQWESSPEERYDMTGGYDALSVNESISFSFNVTNGPTKRRSNHSFYREVSVAMRFHDLDSEKIIQATLYVNRTLVVYKNITQQMYHTVGMFVSTISGVVPPGHAQLDLKVVRGNMQICAIIIC